MVPRSDGLHINHIESTKTYIFHPKITYSNGKYPLRFLEYKFVQNIIDLGGICVSYLQESPVYQ
jgi:hypothetical protein